MAFICLPRTRRRLSQCIKYLIILSIVLSTSTWIIWTQRYYFLHIFKFVYYSEYRDCVHHRHSYEAKGETSPLYITLAHHGRLGNWLYAYASLLGIAKANGYIPYLEPSHPITYTFRVSKLRSTDAECLLTVRDPMPCGYVPSFNRLPAANISIDGYIQSWKYFSLIEDEIRKEFTFSRSFQELVTSKYVNYVSRYTKEGRTVISVHVRRGDKLSKGFQALGFRPAPLDYFKNAMNFMAKKYPFSVFMVVSDDLKWCTQYLKPVTLQFYNRKDRYSPGNFNVVGNYEESAADVGTKMKSDPIESETIPLMFTDVDSSAMDLGLLTMANHSIISVGTFGWWGAWLANGTVVYYENHVTPGSQLASEMVNEDFFPPHWIAMSSSIAKSVNVLLLLIAFVLSCSLVSL